jgi:hypothetical protein
MKKSVTVVAVLFAVLSVSTGALAAKGLLTGADIKNGSLTGAEFKKQSLDAALFTPSAKRSLRGLDGSQGNIGAAGANGPAGSNGGPGAKGTNGTDGTAGVNGLAGTNGVAGTNGLAGTNGAAGTNGLPGTNGSNGTNGTAGADGTVAPLSATAGTTSLLTGAPLLEVVGLNVPAGKYVVLAKTQLSHTGAGDSVSCQLKADGAMLDQVDMKTHPALAALPVSMQAVTTAIAPSRLSLVCAVLVAGGEARFSSLIALPTA